MSWDQTNLEQRGPDGSELSDLLALLEGIPAGAWVAISTEEHKVISYGIDAQAVFSESRVKGEEHPLIVRSRTAVDDVQLNGEGHIPVYRSRLTYKRFFCIGDEGAPSGGARDDHRLEWQMDQSIWTARTRRRYLFIPAEHGNRLESGYPQLVEVDDRWRGCQSTSPTTIL